MNSRILFGPVNSNFHFEDCCSVKSVLQGNIEIGLHKTGGHSIQV